MARTWDDVKADLEARYPGLAARVEARYAELLLTKEDAQRALEGDD